MHTTDKHNERIANMTFATVYPHYVTKVTSKGRTTEELLQVQTSSFGLSLYHLLWLKT